MLIKSKVHKSSGRFERYGVWWSPYAEPSSIELDCIRAGGAWIKTNGEPAGKGLYYHYRKFQELVWPERLWEVGPYKNHWAEKCLEVWINYTYAGVMGSASAGKSDSFAANALTDWYAWKDCTTTMLTSTDLKSLELRVWGIVKKYHRQAKQANRWIPGHLIEGKQMIIQDPKSEFAEGRDFKNGILGLPTKRGNQFVGLGSYVGIHNKRVRLIVDEANLCNRGFLDSTSNLSKCQDFKLIALGNPNETTNAHGIICEPSTELGGWESGIDQSDVTKTWATKYPNGICLQLPGSDSPNKDAPLDDPPFPFLITPKQMEEDARIWGTEDWHYNMMNRARMPRGQGNRRIITRQSCEKFGALLEPMWRDSRITRMAGLDAAFRGTGGDRCVFTEINFGREVDSNPALISPNSIVSHNSNVPQGRQIIALIDQIIIPIDAGVGAEQPEDQIVQAVRKECERRGIPPANLFYDAGMRTSLVTAFARLWTPEVQSVDFGGKASQDKVSAEINILCCDYYQKFVTELWYSVRYIIESRQFRGMTNEVMWELAAREWKHTMGTNKIEVESKSDMKLKTGRSPDLADSLVVACYGARQRGFVIARLVPEQPAFRGKDWRDKVREKSRKLWNSGQLETSTVNGTF